MAPSNRPSGGRRKTPAARLRVDLTEARAAGLDFDTAWRHARWHALAGAPQREAWVVAFGCTKGAWREAFHGRGDAKLLSAWRTVEVAEVVGDSGHVNTPGRIVA